MRKVLFVSNTRAGSVSARTKEVILKALAADFKLEAADTTSRGHATDLGRAAVADGFDAVIAFGGDGTVNEVAQDLVSTDVALGVIPGGTTNVMARSLGMPMDPVDATAFVAAKLRSGSSRRINVGRIGARYFLFCAGMGFDAEVVRRVEADPEGKRRHANWTFLVEALRTAFTVYRGADPRITLETEASAPERVLFTIVCNARPFSYFKRLPVDACPEAALEKGLDFLALTRIGTATIPRIAWSVLVSRTHPGWRNTRYYPDLKHGSMRATEPLPVQVDGDYIGEMDRVVVRLVPDSLSLLV